MKNKLLIHFQDRDAEKIRWILFDQDGQKIQSSEAVPLETCPKPSPSTQVIILFPTEEILLTQVNLPPAKKSQQITAALFTLEEKLAEDVEFLHAVVTRPPTDTLFSVGIIRQSLIEHWLQKLRAIGITPAFLLPDIFIIPYQENFWTTVFLDNRVLVRTHLYQGFATSKENYEILIKIKPSAVITLLLNIEYIRFLDALKNDQKFFEKFNLLQGKCRQKTSWHEAQQLWRKPLLFALCWLLLLIILVFAKIIFLNVQNKKIEAQISILYHEAYPNATQVTSPEARMAQEINQLNQKGQHQEALKLIAMTQNALKETPDTHIESFNFRDDILLLNIQVQNFEQLEKFIKQLTQNKLTVKQNDAIRKEGNVIAALSISTEKNNT